MRKEFTVKLKGDESRANAPAAIILPFDARTVWGKARVPVNVTINGHTWRSTVGTRGGDQYIVVNAEARQKARVKAGDTVTITLEPDTQKRDVDIPKELKAALGSKFAEKLAGLAFTHKKEFVKWYCDAKKDETRARRIGKMKEMLLAGKTIS